jgi:type IX secretion system PorP/SprF family membrane protein
MQRIRLILAIVFMLPLCASAQQFPFYSQYIYNPYVINPAFVASGRQFEVNATYRRQWANIEDGPKTLQFDIQYPFNPRVAAGINVYEDRTIMLSSTTVMFTYGYKVPLAPGHVLGFGLSGGMISNRLRTGDVSAIDAADPSLLSATNNNMSLDGQFGAYYNFKNLYLGFSLIRLFDNRIVSEDAFQQLKFSQLENKVAYASYRFSFGDGTWAFQPNFMYRFAQANLNFYEATGIISYKSIIDVGGGYREGFGPVLTARSRLGNLEVGFSYDFPSALPQVSTGGTYEIQLKYKFGKTVESPARRVKPQLVAEVTPPVETKTTPVKEQPKEEPKVETVQAPVREEPKQEPVKEQPRQEQVVVKEQPVVKQEPVVQQPEVTATEVPKGGYYLVIGAFRLQEHANSFLRSAKQLGYKVELKRGKDFYYVHMIDHHSDTSDTEKVKKIRATTQFKDAWYTTIEE